MKAGVGVRQAVLRECYQNEDIHLVLNTLCPESNRGGNGGIEFTIQPANEASRLIITSWDEKVVGLTRVAELTGWWKQEAKVHSNGEGLTVRLMPQIPAPRYGFTCMDSIDKEPVLELFERCFSEPASQALWQWKYGSSNGLSLVARKHDRLVAHYGCVHRTLHFKGRSVLGLQMCDVMVDPSERGISLGMGLLERMATLVQALYFGYGQKYAFGFGFPNDRHLKLGVKLGLYAKIEEFLAFEWSAIAAKRIGLTRGRWLASLEHVKEVVNQLWKDMRGDLHDAIVCDRNHEYLRARYERHPGFKYHYLLVESGLTCKPKGLVILRQEGDACRIMDFVGSLDHIRVMLSHARGFAARLGATKVLLWINSGNASRFKSQEALGMKTGISVASTCKIQRIPTADVANNWWLTMGDTDYL